MVCHFLLQGGLPDPGTKLMSLALAGRYFTTAPPARSGDIEINIHFLDNENIFVISFPWFLKYKILLDFIQLRQKN